MALYTGTATGNNGSLVVEVTVDTNKIISVKVIEHAETEGLADPAIEKVPTSIVTRQSIEVETISGATNTSKAIINATKDALTKAANK